MKIAHYIATKWQMLSRFFALLMLVWLTMNTSFMFAADGEATIEWSKAEKSPIHSAIPDEALELMEGEGQLFFEDFDDNYRCTTRFICKEYSFRGYSVNSYADYHPELHFPPPNC
jgi:hypothetical protein